MNSPLAEVSESDGRPIGRAGAAAVSEAIASLASPAQGVPLDALVQFGSKVDSNLTLDMESMRRIGIPVLVLREQPVARPAMPLTRREREVARLIATGRRNREIADTLGISLSTVKDHVHNILTRTGLGSRTALAAAVVRGGP
jgi:DNA-binding NarL/FixJ family response regulator